jgi:oligoribonuclease NrnB/cAMP/cGMP phosphodiesterase (DHH superfamily)
LNSNNIKFEVLDHHEEEFQKTSSIATKNNLPLVAMFDPKECGASLAWKRFFPGVELPSFLRYIKKNDTWTQETDEDWFVIEYIKTNLPNNASINEVEEFARGFNEKEAMELGKPLYQKTLQDVKRSTKVLTVVDFDGTEVAITNESVNPSLVGHELARRAPRGLGMAFYINVEKSRVKAAVRGKGASELCRKFGGGGHKEAAGFEMSLEDFSQYLKSAKKIKEK